MGEEELVVESSPGGDEKDYFDRQNQLEKPRLLKCSRWAGQFTTSKSIMSFAWAGDILDGKAEVVLDHRIQIIS